MISVWPEILSLKPYRPGKPIAETKREFGLSSVIKLASNENPLGPSPMAIKAIEAHLQEANLYPDAAFYDLRQAASKIFNLNPERITFGNGSNEFIDLLIHLVCAPGDKILIPKYSFIAYRISAQAARVETIESKVAEDLSIDMDDLIDKLNSDEKIKIIFLANPNNPTGLHIPELELKALIDATEKRGCMLVVDEAYFEFVRAKNYSTALKFLNQSENLVVLRTMSKAYGLANLRIGYLLASAHIVSCLDRIRNPFNVGGLTQVAALAALKDQAHVEKTVRLTWKGVDDAVEMFGRYGMPCYSSQGNFLLVQHSKAETLFKFLLERGVIVRPVDNYGLNHCLRISIGLPEEMSTLFEKLTEFRA